VGSLAPRLISAATSPGAGGGLIRHSSVQSIASRASRGRPGRRRAAEKRDEIAALQAHSINSSARASSVGGTLRPRVLAVLRLRTSSSLVGCNTGRSAGFVPLRNSHARPTSAVALNPRDFRSECAGSPRDSYWLRVHDSFPGGHHYVRTSGATAAERRTHAGDEEAVVRQVVDRICNRTSSLAGALKPDEMTLGKSRLGRAD
jgi:hypothetical protein